MRLQPIWFFWTVFLATEFLSGQKCLAQAKHPDPKSGLPAPVGSCREESVDGKIMPQVKTRQACAVYPAPTVWVEGDKAVSFSKSDPAKVAKGGAHPAGKSSL